jgi:hypothetical protein
LIRVDREGERGEREREREREREEMGLVSLHRCDRWWAAECKYRPKVREKAPNRVRIASK